MKYKVDDMGNSQQVTITECIKKQASTSTKPSGTRAPTIKDLSLFYAMLHSFAQ